MTTPIESDRSWYRVTLRDGRGPRRRNLALPNALVRFNLFQSDPEADDAPSKRLLLSAEHAAIVEAMGLFDIEPTEAPAPGPLAGLAPRGPRVLDPRELKVVEAARQRKRTKPSKPSKSPKPAKTETAKTATEETPDAAA